MLRKDKNKVADIELSRDYRLLPCTDRPPLMELILNSLKFYREF